MYIKRLLFTLLLTIICVIFSQAQQNKILVFSKTAGYRHESIEAGKDFFKNLANQLNYEVLFSENADDINENQLRTLAAVVFLNTTGDILNNEQQVQLERYIQAGGGFMGIHAAADCEYNWPWYNGLVGAWFMSHPGGDVSNVQDGEMTVVNQQHPSTKHLSQHFNRADEFYDFKSLKKEKLSFLITLDEKSYKGGKMGDFHPMAWFQNYDGGKVFYSNFGHVPSTFSEPDMMKHFSEGLKSVLAGTVDYSKAYSTLPPEENRFVKTVLVKNLDEPMELAVLPDERVLVAERKGLLKIYDPMSKEMTIAAHIDVYKEFEYGLMGVNIDPDFINNHWVYLFYSPETDEHKDQFLSRFEFDLKTNKLVKETEKVILRFPAKRVECCHTGGSIDWDANGNLFLSTGDDTNPFASDGYGPFDFREGRSGWDAMRSSANTNDLRGKILRIKPTKDGSYTIPDGNLFPIGLTGTRPEIYVMGNRNPYRIGVDQHNGYLYWGEIGPDAGKPDPKRGPEGYVEFNQARKAGFYGWPMFTGDNYAYNHFNFETNVSGEKYNPEYPINDSPNNTGLKELPPSQKPFVWYSYAESKLFPELGKGGCNPMGGPVYYSDDYPSAKGKFPSYFDGKFFGYEWMRDWIMVFSFDKEGNYTSMEPFMPNTRFYHPMDMAFSNKGTLYLLEYGLNWFSQNEEAMLSRIEYNNGNRTPVVNLSVDKEIGAAPLTVHFSSVGSLDYDGDQLTYEWDFGPGMKKSKLANPIIKFKKAGEYNVKLNIKDEFGNVSSAEKIIKVGNEPPVLEIITTGNQTFYLGQDKIDYEVQVNDKEDGTLNAGINADDVVVSINYLEGYDKNMIAIGHQRNLTFASGRRLIDNNDCKSCHSPDQKSIGPAYKEIASKYTSNNSNINLLAEKIINGGGGVWGEQAMAAHPDLELKDAQSIVRYILSINDTQLASLPVKDQYNASDLMSKKSGAILIQASYSDKGGTKIGSLSNSTTKILRFPLINATQFDAASDNTLKFEIPENGEVAIANDNGYLAFDEIDLSGIKKILLTVFGQKGQTSGGVLQIRQDSETGMVVGEAKVEEDNILPIEIILGEIQEGTHKLYLTFSNKNAEGKPLFALKTIEFK